MELEQTYMREERWAFPFNKALRLCFLPREGDRGRSIRTRKIPGCTRCRKSKCFINFSFLWRSVDILFLSVYPSTYVIYYRQ